MLLYRTKTNDDLDWCVNHGIHNRAKNFLKVHFKGNKFLTIWSFHHRKQKIRISGGVSFLKQISWTWSELFTIFLLKRVPILPIWSELDESGQENCKQRP